MGVPVLSPSFLPSLATSCTLGPAKTTPACKGPGAQRGPADESGVLSRGPGSRGSPPPPARPTPGGRRGSRPRAAVRSAPPCSGARCRGRCGSSSPPRGVHAAGAGKREPHYPHGPAGIPEPHAAAARPQRSRPHLKGPSPIAVGLTRRGPGRDGVPGAGAVCFSSLLLADRGRPLPKHWHKGESKVWTSWKSEQHRIFSLLMP